MNITLMLQAKIKQVGTRGEIQAIGGAGWSAEINTGCQSVLRLC